MFGTSHELVMKPVQKALVAAEVPVVDEFAFVDAVHSKQLGGDATPLVDVPVITRDPIRLLLFSSLNMAMSNVPSVRSAYPFATTALSVRM